MNRVNIVRDEAGLQALGPAWDALEARARAAGRPDQLFASHRYVTTAWQHLRQPGDRLYVLTWQPGDPPADQLAAVWPLVLRSERASGLRLRVLRPIGIWEGERPGVLSDGEADLAWAALWQGLLAARDDWHVLDLRELDEGSWPLRHLPAAQPGLRVTQQADHAAPWQPLTGTWDGHEASRAEAPRAALAAARATLAARAQVLETVVITEPAGITTGLQRCLDIETSQAGTQGLHLLRDDAARQAFYQAFLPLLAARGEAEVRLLQADGDDVAGLIRWRCGGVWIERHAVERAGWAEAAPATLLLLSALAQGWRGDAQASDLLLLPDASGRAAALKGWYDGLRPTWRLSVWNLRSRMCLLAMLARLKGR